MNNCGRWGTADASITDDPHCPCKMCIARRFDRTPPREKAARAKLRAQLIH